MGPNAKEEPHEELSLHSLERFRGGDGEAFLAVYDAHAPHVRALVARFFSSAFEREEALQEVWLLAHRMCGGYDPQRGPLGPWMRTLASNRCKELLRARGRRFDLRDGVGDEGLAGAADPEADARAMRVREAVERFAGRLTGEEASVLKLSFLEERQHDDVARALGITVRRCKYLRKKLIARAAEDGDLRAALGEVRGD